MKANITETTGCNIYKEQNIINTTCENIQVPKDNWRDSQTKFQRNGRPCGQSIKYWLSLITLHMGYSR
jgi:hypothetical protein